MVMRRLLVLFSACIFGVAALSAQGVDKAVERSIAKYFQEYKSERTSLAKPGLDGTKRNKIVVDNKKRKITIYSNEAFAGQAFTPETVDAIYGDIRKLLPSKLKKYKIEVVYDKRTIDERVPNIYKKGSADKKKLWGAVDYKGKPWVKNSSRPFAVSQGLAGRHIALWQSHGRFYSPANNEWRWQRPQLYCTVEDLFTPSLVLPFLMPMLENAGAVVYTPRERDTQPECVIVDNDKSGSGSRYFERTGRGREWKAVKDGFASKKEVYIDGDNPFTEGTARVAETSRGEKRSVSEAMWRPNIPVGGEYAVYVSYKTFDNSVSDALYKVKHSGGVTEFRVNQQMGGGTWVYLGTFHFNKGESKEQYVLLSNDSKNKGVVCADAVRFGGGTGNVARGAGGMRSGLPRHLEAARYNLQMSGFPKEVYSASERKDDYRDDVLAHGHAVNYLSGGSVYLPDTLGLGVPLELAFGFHSDAGYNNEDAVHGSLGIVTTDVRKGMLPVGKSRHMSRDAISFLLNNVQDDLTARYGTAWRIRGILDRNYGETRVPRIPSVIFESLSHQNYADMAHGHDPDFKFTLARSVYKSLLKHISYVHGTDYVVQPLPVRKFHMIPAVDNKSVTLKWEAVDDPRESTAVAERFVVYTKVGDAGFDNGTVTENNSIVLPVKNGELYSFKVTAVNDGGESLPSEVLSLYLEKGEKPRVLLVNGFHRLSGPHQINTASESGFDMDFDPGVPYMYTYEYCGRQLDFSRENIGDETGLGLSDDSFMGVRAAGNTFDYPFVHGKALAANGISFVSCGSEAVMEGSVRLANYKVVDLILGVEKQGGKGSYLGYNRAYKTFPRELQNKIAAYCKSGGNLFVSGAFIASDMVRNKNDKAFICDVLHYDYGGSVTDLSETRISASTGAKFVIPRTLNEDCYAVSRPDILVPVNGAFVSFVFNGNRASAGVAYAGDYKVISTSFPFESVKGDKARKELMAAIMRFLMPRK